VLSNDYLDLYVEQYHALQNPACHFMLPVTRPISRRKHNKAIVNANIVAMNNIDIKDEACPLTPALSSAGSTTLSI